MLGEGLTAAEAVHADEGPARRLHPTRRLLATIRRSGSGRASREPAGRCGKGVASTEPSTQRPLKHAEAAWQVDRHWIDKCSEVRETAGRSHCLVPQAYKAAVRSATLPDPRRAAGWSARFVRTCAVRPHRRRQGPRAVSSTRCNRPPVAGNCLPRCTFMAYHHGFEESRNDMLDRMRRHRNWLKWSLALVCLAFVIFLHPDSCAAPQPTPPRGVGGGVPGTNQRDEFRRHISSARSSVPERVRQQHEHAAPEAARRRPQIPAAARRLARFCSPKPSAFTAPRATRTVLARISDTVLSGKWLVHRRAALANSCSGMQRPPLVAADFENSVRRAG